MLVGPHPMFVMFNLLTEITSFNNSEIDRCSLNIQYQKFYA